MLHPIFHECHDDFTKRYDLSKPFAHGDHIFATDGRMMVVCPRGNIELPREPDRRTPDVRGFLDAKDLLERIDVPLPEAVESDPCEYCAGKGIIDNGILVTIFDDEYEIRQNGKLIWFDCPQCGGKGTIRNSKGIVIHEPTNFMLASHYVGMLRRHGVVSVSIPVKQVGKADNPKNACQFQGDGFRGWLMPVVNAKPRTQTVSCGTS